MTNRKSYHRILWYYSGPSRVIANKGSVSQFGETVYIYEVNGARKVKSSAQVAINNLDPMQKFFLSGVAGRTVPQFNFLIF